MVNFTYCSNNKELKKCWLLAPCRLLRYVYNPYFIYVGIRYSKKFEKYHYNIYLPIGCHNIFSLAPAMIVTYWRKIVWYYSRRCSPRLVGVWLRYVLECHLHLQALYCLLSVLSILLATKKGHGWVSEIFYNLYVYYVYLILKYYGPCKLLDNRTRFQEVILKVWFVQAFQRKTASEKIEFWSILKIWP